MNTDYEAYKHLKELGVPASLKGYAQMKIAISEVLKDPDRIRGVVKGLYVDIAEATNTNVQRAERCMRHVIEYIFDNTDPEVVREYFGNSISMNSGRLSVTHFIAGVCEYIRMHEEV